MESYVEQNLPIETPINSLENISGEELILKMATETLDDENTEIHQSSAPTENQNVEYKPIDHIGNHEILQNHLQSTTYTISEASGNNMILPSNEMMMRNVMINVGQHMQYSDNTISSLAMNVNQIIHQQIDHHDSHQQQQQMTHHSSMPSELCMVLNAMEYPFHGHHPLSTSSLSMSSTNLLQHHPSSSSSSSSTHIHPSLLPITSSSTSSSSSSSLLLQEINNHNNSSSLTTLVTTSDIKPPIHVVKKKRIEPVSLADGPPLFTKRGYRKFTHDGYIYNYESTRQITNGCSYYFYCENIGKGCKGRLTKRYDHNGNLIKVTATSHKEDICLPSQSKIVARQVRREIIDMYSEGQVTLDEAYANTISRVIESNPDVVHYMPSKSSLQSAASRKCRERRLPKGVPS